MRPITPVAFALIVVAVVTTACDVRSIAPQDLSREAATTVTPDGVAKQTARHTPTVTAAPASAPTVASIATSRGPSLEATDPEGVKLDAGDFQLVEFFRFT